MSDKHTHQKPADADVADDDDVKSPTPTNPDDIGTITGSNTIAKQIPVRDADV
jgi:hypothetical protein